VRVLGVDFSLNSTGYAVADYNKPLDNDLPKIVNHGTIKINAKKMSGQERVCHIKGVIKDLISKHRPEVVRIEGYAMGFGAGRIFDRAEAIGVLKNLFYESGVNIEIVPPSTLKMIVTGNGHASKEDMIKFVNNYLKVDLSEDQDDEADAIGLASTHKKPIVQRVEQKKKKS
jgi:crossover junction endodeoxyribonuclease RuvC